MFQSALLSTALMFYWPLQDHISPIVVDASGQGRHGVNGNCPVQKPVAVKFRPSNTGLQLLPLRSLSCNVDAKVDGAWTLQWLVRWLAVSNGSPLPSTPFLTLRSSTGHMHHLSFTSHLCLEWTRHGNAVVTSRDSLAIDTTYHVALVAPASGPVTCFVNGQEIFQSPSGVSDIVGVEFALTSPAMPHQVPLLSHVALIARDLTAEELQPLVRAAVPSPQLVAHGADPVDPSVICRESEALEDSGYRVSAIHLWSGDYFDGVQLTYQTKHAQTTPGRAWTTGGAATATMQTLQLLEGEFISEVRGRRGAWMDQLSVTTNFGRSLTAGGNGGGPFVVPIPPGHMARAFSFELGDHINQPVVFSCPAPRGPVYVALKAAIASAGKDATKLAAQGVARYLTNLADKPHNVAFHKIKASNAFFVKNVAPLGVQLDAVFDACGFDRIQGDGGDVFFVYRKDTAPAHAVRRALHDIATFLALTK
ncbi:hypothetical protein H310_02367 [Aphanomyces invadans]|uniref:Jacalin-type lectin domain-containing protein n=1 Tax=Aphanomyces invadans TaxID=157072 RepID=A0A024UP81_9STRA|nr:hypothetical protein H310_02367 [Aphanomyces invadans]ETW07980.1 hypothetical protein H310_02367 [Aphanomyces invadans]|eukprot:XP_008864073.1 hypothetical protein H310_02367 [Aphanomyces invadans]